MSKSSVGQFLINSYIPKEFQIPFGSTQKDIQNKFIEWAKNDPKSYSDNIPKIKRIADDITTYEGLTVGLDDLEPMIKERTTLLNKYTPKFNAAPTDDKKKEIVADAIREAEKLSLKGKGSLVEMVQTGAKGTAGQLMKNIISPISSRESNNTPYPYLNNKSFSEGLSSGGYWVDSIEARNATIAAKTSTAIPGDLGKQMFNALNSVVITTKDCKTQNGIAMKIDDPNVLDRYLAKDVDILAKRNTVITSRLVSALKKKKIEEIIVRSPMTCEARDGVCQFCYGINVSGSLHNIGTNIGTIAAQSLSEPLTQMALSTKHGVILAGKQQDEIGMSGVRKLLSKPKILPTKATLAQLEGVVTKVTKAPQGGNYIYINDVEHYVPITNEVLFSKGQKVARGDALSDGMKDPREFTELRGLGSGRSLYIWALHNAYNPKDPVTKQRVGIPIDKRHLEVLAKKDLNHVVINEHNDTFSKGDIIEYNQLKDYLKKSVEEIPTKDSAGEYLGREYLHYTVGTQITPNIINNLLSRGINSIVVTNRRIDYSPYVTNIRQVPLLKQDFIARMSHHELKNTLTNAVNKGEVSEISSYDPVPSLIRGVTFGEGFDGRY